MQQNTAEWLKMRKNFIGASDAPIIMGTSKFRLQDGRYKTPFTLWQEKLGLVADQEENAACAYGKKMEEPARLVYESMTGHIVAPEVIFHKDVNYMMASLDGLSFEKDIAVEIKNSNADDHSVARSNRVPEHYYPQVQHQLDCLHSLYGHDRLHYFSFHKGEGIVVEVKRDLSYLEDLYEREQKFWQCVQNLEEPELIALDFREQGHDWQAKAQKLWELEESLRVNTKLAKELKDDLKRLSEGRNSRAGQFLFVASNRKGSIDYSLIPELRDKDLECYRKPPSQNWSLSVDHKSTRSSIMR